MIKPNICGHNASESGIIFPVLLQKRPSFQPCFKICECGLEVCWCGTGTGKNFQHAQVTSACTWDQKHPMRVRSCTGSFWSEFRLRLRLSSLYEVGLKRMKVVLTFKMRIFVNTGLWNCKVIETTTFVDTPLLQN